MKLTHLLVILILTGSITAQEGTFYNFEEALSKPSQARILVINHNNDDVKPLDERIEQLTELEELIIFPKYFQDTVLDAFRKLPTELTSCTKLHLIKCSGLQHDSLPDNFAQNKNLNTLIISGSNINLDHEIDKLIALSNLNHLEIINLPISPANLKKLQSIPGLALITESVQLPQDAFDLQFHDTYMVFRNEQEATRFIKSMPLDFGLIVKKYGGEK